jgi:hypothetical protein
MPATLRKQQRKVLECLTETHEAQANGRPRPRCYAKLSNLNPP